MPKQQMYLFSLKGGITIFIKVNRHRTELIYAKATNVSIFLKSWNRYSSKSTDIERNTSMPKQQMYQFSLKAGITIFIKVNRHRSEHIYAITTNVTIFLKSWNNNIHQSQQTESRTHLCLAGLGGSVGCAVRLETRRSRVQAPPRSATFFRGEAGIAILIKVNRHKMEHIYAKATNVSIFLKSWNNDIHQSQQT